MKEKITEIDYYECLRCNINKSDNPTRMCPCPRGGCEAVLKGKIVTTEKLILNSEPQAPEGWIDKVFEDHSQYFTGNGDYSFQYMDKIHFKVAAELYSSLQNKVAQDKLKKSEDEWMNELKTKEEAIKLYQKSLDRIKELESLSKWCVDCEQEKDTVHTLCFECAVKLGETENLERIKELEEENNRLKSE